MALVTVPHAPVVEAVGNHTQRFSITLRASAEEADNASNSGSSNSLGGVAPVTTERTFAEFRAFRRQLKRGAASTLAASSSSTASPRKKWRLARVEGERCQCRAPCPWQQVVPAALPRFPSRWHGLRGNNRQQRQAALQAWLRAVHAAVWSLGGEVVSDKLQRRDCAMVNAYTDFMGLTDLPRMPSAVSPRREGAEARRHQPLALPAWRDQYEPKPETESETSDAVDEADEQEEKPTIASALMGAAASDAGHLTREALPRLAIKSMAVETMDGFLDDFCDHLLMYCASDLVELQVETLSHTRRWQLALFVACRIGHLYGAQLILHHHVDDANAALDDGTSCLQIAARMGRNGIVSLLLAQGADVNHANDMGVTPLIAACRNGCARAADLLLRAGADISAASSRGTYPLHAAVVAQSVEIVRMLLVHGADVNVTTVNGITPLHFAAKLGSLELSALLLRWHADPQQCSKSGSNALMIAAANDYLAICDLLYREMRHHHHAQPRPQEGAALAITDSAGVLHKLTKSGSATMARGASPTRRPRQPRASSSHGNGDATDAPSDE